MSFNKTVAKRLTWVATFYLFLLLIPNCSTPGKAQDKAAAVDPPPKKEKAEPPKSTPKKDQGEKATLKIDKQKAWNTFRGGPRRTGRAYVKGPKRPKLKWVFRTKGRIYADASVTKDNTIYVASHDHFLYAVNQEGREIWSYDAGGKIWTTPAIAKDGTVYIGSDEDRLVSLSQKGKELWVFSTAQPLKKGEKPEDGRWDVDTSPVITADGTIVFGSHLNLYALRQSGLVRWHFKAGVDKAKIFSSPAIGPDGTIYFGTQGQYFFAINQSAKVVFTIKTEGDNDSTPAVDDDGRVVFASDDGKVRAVSPTGDIKWTSDLGAPIRAPVSIGHEGTVYISTFGPKPFLAALDRDTGKEKWRFHTEPGEGAFYGIQSGALIDVEGYIYFGGRDHYIYCLSPKGDLIWKYKTGDQVDSGPVLGPDGTLYIGSDDKRLYAFTEAT